MTSTGVIWAKSAAEDTRFEYKFLLYIQNKYQMLKVKVRTQEYRMNMIAILQFQIHEYKDDQSPIFQRIVKNSWFLKLMTSFSKEFPCN